jgi:hypothetical protein
MEEAVRLPGPAGALEGLFDYLPEEVPDAAILVLSPHPRLAGDLRNNVIRVAARDFAGRSLPTLRFNYRGIGKSQGLFADPLDNLRYWSGVPEDAAQEEVVGDASAALDWLRAYAPTVHLFGYSFGAVVALRLAARDSTVRSIVAVAFPAAACSSSPSALLQVTCPLLAVHADADFATRAEDVERALAALPAWQGLRVLEDTDHFFRGREGEVASVAAEFFASASTRSGT